MRKLKLEDLNVDSFETEAGLAERGTVGAYYTDTGSCPGTVGALSCRATALQCCPRTEATGYCC